MEKYMITNQSNWSHVEPGPVSYAEPMEIRLLISISDGAQKENARGTTGKRAARHFTLPLADNQRAN